MLENDCAFHMDSYQGTLTAVIYDVEINVYFTSGEWSDYSENDPVVNKDGERPTKWSEWLNILGSFQQNKL